ncbi:hypothetical protein K2173_014676 [Erythroxylum novogranatense]|uniref:Pentatricopeptide repeat-containing protein n=1 Tax=Erythroxylum novogranatense TaxID=1862640 RepID=A0AAV8THS3_9ROSI|nr:hypothetical protein K2173_014676 [Erythroxylum novogranatense]
MKAFTRTLTIATEIAKTQQKRLVDFNLQLARLTRSGLYNDALRLFAQIQRHLRPDHYSLSTTLAACASLRDVKFGNQLHAYASKAGFKAYTQVANTLLSLYAKSQDVVSVKWVFGEIEYPDVYSYTTLLSASAKMGCVDFALEVFDKMRERDVTVWNAMITGCMESGNAEIGFSLFRDMLKYGVRCDHYSFASVLSSCYWELADYGRQVQSLVIKTGLLLRNSVVNALITMYFHSENVEDAFLVFEETVDLGHNHITYNVMIDGFVTMNRAHEAFQMFQKMLEGSLRPTEYTFTSLMSSRLFTRVGYQIHALVVKMGFEACTSVINAAIVMYSSCGDLHAARMVFDRLEGKDHVSWNTMISTYCQWNFGRSAISAYQEMQRADIEPDEFTFGSLLASSELIEYVNMIQALVFKNGFHSNIHVSNALMSAYSKHGNIDQAYRIFCSMVSRSMISWNTIISAFLLNRQPIEGLELVPQLLMSELRPNDYTLTIILSICARISALIHGKQVHGYILRFGFTSEGSLGNALITMYSKCGHLDWSLRVFNKMNERDVITWNAMISAYAQHGQGKEAVHCLKTMQGSSEAKPDRATFTAILSACSRAGLVENGTGIFNSMENDFGISPGIDHFSCVIDLLGRSGHFDKVERIINSENFEAHPNIWWSLLSACAAHGNLKLGRLVAKFLLEVEKDNPSVYVLLSNAYASDGQWEEAAKIRQLIDNIQVMKQPGCSWIS